MVLNKIMLTESSPTSIQFLTDAMFGKLGIYLRLLGFDTAQADNRLKDTEVWDQAVKEHRILLTRDKGFYARVKDKSKDPTFPKAVFLDSKSITQQLVILFRTLSLDLKLLDLERPSAAARCSVCNAPLTQVEKNSIIDQVPPGTTTQFDQFWKCSNPSCKQIFWIGRHWVQIQKIFSQVKQNLVNVSI